VLRLGLEQSRREKGYDHDDILTPSLPFLFIGSQSASPPKQSSFIGNTMRWRKARPRGGTPEALPRLNGFEEF
jgi:hypothetical protein